MKNFLVISFNFEPNTNPRAIRWNAILDYIKKKNISVEFITHKKNKKKYPKNINFYEHKNKLFDLFTQKRSKQIMSNSKHSIFKNLKIKLLKLLEIFYKIIGKHIIWPDYAFFSIYPFYKTAIRLITKKNIKNIITVSHPFSSHVVGLLLKIRFPYLIWDTDSGDPFYPMKEPKPNNTTLYKFFNFYVEKNILQRCRKFYVNNLDTKKKYSEYFKLYRKKIKVVEPLSLFQKKNLSKTKNYKFLFRLYYAGSFYSKIRSPKPFLQIINQLIKKFPNRKKDMKIYIFTNSLIFNQELKKYPDLKSVFIVQEPIEYLKLMQFIKNDMISLNFGNKTNLQIPSKLYESIGMGLKIVNFHYNIDKMSEKILNNYPNHININLDNTIDLKILNNFILKKQSIVSKNFFKKNFKKNTIEYISNKYFGKL
jgi:hypothetical protein